MWPGYRRYGIRPWIATTRVHGPYPLAVSQWHLRLLEGAEGGGGGVYSLALLLIASAGTGHGY